ncbi:hypothetical protein [Nocardia miyunensis]|nr:hypothetical protein [Nocardia miyunensis]
MRNPNNTQRQQGTWLFDALILIVAGTISMLVVTGLLLAWAAVAL